MMIELARRSPPLKNGRGPTAARSLCLLAVGLLAAGCGLDNAENPDAPASYKQAASAGTGLGAGVGTAAASPTVPGAAMRVTPASATLRSGRKQTIEVQSVGTEAVQLGSPLTAFSGANAANFTLIGNLCPRNGVLAAGQVCRLTLIYVRSLSTNASDVDSATLTVSSLNAGSRSVSLTGVP